MSVNTALIDMNLLLHWFLHENSLGSDAVTYAAMLEYVKAFPWLLKQHLQVSLVLLQHTTHSCMHTMLAIMCSVCGS
jgi:hypothetical protein